MGRLLDAPAPSARSAAGPAGDPAPGGLDAAWAVHVLREVLRRQEAIAIDVQVPEGKAQDLRPRAHVPEPALYRHRGHLLGQLQQVPRTGVARGCPRGGGRDHLWAQLWLARRPRHRRPRQLLQAVQGQPGLRGAQRLRRRPPRAASFVGQRLREPPAAQGGGGRGPPRRVHLQAGGHERSDVGRQASPAWALGAIAALRHKAHHGVLPGEVALPLAEGRLEGPRPDEQRVGDHARAPHVAAAEDRASLAAWGLARSWAEPVATCALKPTGCGGERRRAGRRPGRRPPPRQRRLLRAAELGVLWQAVADCRRPRVVRRRRLGSADQRLGGGGLGRQGRVELGGGVPQRADAALGQRPGGAPGPHRGPAKVSELEVRRLRLQAEVEEQHVVRLDVLVLHPAALKMLQGLEHLSDEPGGE
mmetsp:Transcript_51450/g.146896  ORF Transcript_51450/g.146896 Transcript_51450/m.146896 type:complete len:418 (-) Transcript_51450:370-1623(-)